MALDRGPHGGGRCADGGTAQRDPTPHLATDQRELEAARRDQVQLAALLQRRMERETELEQRIAALTDERGRLLAEAQRIRDSRAWRYGHRIMRAMGRLTRRARGERGAIDVMVARLEGPPPPPQRSRAAASDVRDRIPASRDHMARHQPLEHRVAARQSEPVTVVVPIFNAAGALERCLESLARHTGPGARLVLVDDASTDPRIDDLLQRYGRLDNVEVLANDANRGFTASVNRGIACATGDVVVLNSDTVVGPRWLDQLSIAASTASDIGTVTAVSDNAGAFSVPDIGRANPLPAGRTTEDVARAFSQSARRLLVQTPTGNGFCLYIRRACLDDVGAFDEAAFPRGYGEENDFCMRAAERGWRHVIDDATWVHHEREASFGAEKHELAAAARATVDRRHPTYTEQVRSFVGSPRLAEMHSAAQTTVATLRRPGARVLPRVLFVLHEGGGGVPATNRDLLRGLADRYDCLALTSDGRTLRLWQAEGAGTHLISSWPLAAPWRVTDMTSPEQAVVARSILSSYGIELVHVRHLFKHSLDLPNIAAALGLPLVVSFHDYYMSCPTVHLLDESDRYCGGICTPGDGACRIPSPMLEGTPPVKHGYVHEWRSSFGPILERADALVTTSQNVREVYLRSYPRLDPEAFEIIEHGRDLEQAEDVAVTPQPGGPIRILVPGNLDVHKGAEVLVRLKELDTAGRLDLHFLGLVDERYHHLGTQHGRYVRDEFAERARAIAPAFVGIFSITAETYSHSLTEAWSAGVPVLASNLGALSERVDRHGGGWTLPIDDPEETYRRICEIADDPAEHARQRAAATVADLPNVGQMADDYHALYQRVLARRRSFTSQRGGTPARLDRDPLRVAAYLPFASAVPPASAYIRMLRRFDHPRTGWNVAGRIAADRHLLRDFGHADVALVQRNGVATELVPRFVESIRRREARLVVDVDDDLFALGADDAVYGETLRGLRLLLDAGDTVMVTSERLRDALGIEPDRAAIVPNMHDERLWFGPIEEDPAAGRPDDPRLRLLYMGTRTHAADLELIRPVLDTLRNERGIDCELFVIGGAERSQDNGWYTEIGVPRSIYPQFVPWLRRMRGSWDIALAPLRDTRFNQGKSDLKLLDYGALGLAGVYSDVAAFDTCTHGVTGLRTANTVDAWAQAIERLAVDPDLRAGIAQNAFDYVRDERTLESEGSRWIDALCGPSVRAAPVGALAGSGRSGALPANAG